MSISHLVIIFLVHYGSHSLPVEVCVLNYFFRIESLPFCLNIFKLVVILSTVLLLLAFTKNPKHFLKIPLLLRLTTFFQHLLLLDLFLQLSLHLLLFLPLPLHLFPLHFLHLLLLLQLFFTFSSIYFLDIQFLVGFICSFGPFLVFMNLGCV